MSITPYNNFTVRDLSGIQQPYLNSSTELGYFSGTSVGTTPQNRWRSLQAVLNTNNGIASLDASGLTILNPGVYSIKLSLFPTSTQDVSSNISFNFGTRYLFDVSTNVVANSFGGVCPTGMFTYDASNNFSIPGIITWVADGYSSGNTGSNFVKTQTDELSFNYSTAGIGGQIYSGNCTTKMTFLIIAPTTIYFNVSTNSSTGITMGNCYFTLQLIYSYSFSWTARNTGLNPAPASTWSSIASDSTGQYLAAVSSNDIYNSSNYGKNWFRTNIGADWRSIASSSNGQYLAAVAVGTTTGGIYTSNNYGNTWVKIYPVNASWRSIASSSSGQYLAAVVNGGTIYTSSNFGTSWTARNTGLNPAPSVSWRSIASSSNGQKLAAVSQSSNTGIYTSSDSGANWTRQTALVGGGFLPATSNWTSIASDSTGQYLAAVSQSTTTGIYTSSNSGNSWTRRTNGLPTTAAWTSIASDSTGQMLAAVVDLGTIYTSSNFGANWRALTNGVIPYNGLPATGRWQSIASSSSGQNLAAVATVTTIYTGAYT